MYVGELVYDYRIKRVYFSAVCLVRHLGCRRDGSFTNTIDGLFQLLLKDVWSQRNIWRNFFGKFGHLTRPDPTQPDPTRGSTRPVCSSKPFTNKLCQLWSYWTKVHEIFTRYRGIIYAVNGHIEVAISHSVREARATNEGSLPFFHKIGCHVIVPGDIRKRGPDRSSEPQTFSFGENISKIGPAHA